MKTLVDSEGAVTLTGEIDGNKEIIVNPINNTFIPIQTCRTNYPTSLIELIFQTIKLPLALASG
jgi:hypothetical protein